MPVVCHNDERIESVSSQYSHEGYAPGHYSMIEVLSGLHSVGSLRVELHAPAPPDRIHEIQRSILAACC